MAAKIDMQKMMEIYKKVGTPGEQHKLLAKLEGSWTTKATCLADAASPKVSTGTCEQTLILDGHYLRQEYSGEKMGEPFTGLCFMGFNNQTKQFESTWIDSMSTSMYKFEGTASSDGRTITQECRYDDPVRGSAVRRVVTRIKDDNTLEFEMFITPRGEKEEKILEIAYARKAGVLRKAA
jgi:Protein of unknown function (DUF1579)